MKFWIGGALLALSSGAWAQACPPQGWPRDRLEALRAADFEIADAAERTALAHGLIDCLASPDPFLRDAIGYDGLSHMLRAGQIADAGKVTMTRTLLARLQTPDPDGFAAPFAALMLSETVRADRIARYLPDDLRAEVAAAAAAYLAGVSDYRGFDEREGWRHGVAHGADLAMQLAYDPNLTDVAALARLRDAVGAQAVTSAHAYVYGEPERLGRAVVALTERRAFTEAEWTAWFTGLATPAPAATWREALATQAGLARRHNLHAFLLSLWTTAKSSPGGPADMLLPGVEAALQAMP